MRSASLSGYMTLVRSLGRDPALFMRTVGLTPECLQDPETLIPRDAARELLEITARATRTEDLALQMAAQHPWHHRAPCRGSPRPRLRWAGMRPATGPG